jgi:GTP-binding protein
MLDVSACGGEEDPVAAFSKVDAELGKWGRGVDHKPRWLVLNKLDTFEVIESERRCDEIVAALAWGGPVYRVSALRGDGVRQLVFDIMVFLEQMDREHADPGGLSTD